MGGTRGCRRHSNLCARHAYGVRKGHGLRGFGRTHFRYTRRHAIRPITATRALDGVMAPIRSHTTVAELTPESMGQALGVSVTRVSAEHYGYTQQLPGDWSFSVQRQRVPSVGPRVDLAFSPVDEAEPSPPVICSPDFAHFTAAVESLGFTRTTSRGEHGRWIFDAFDRPGQHIEVYPLVHPGDTHGTDLTCVGRVSIR